MPDTLDSRMFSIRSVCQATLLCARRRLWPSRECALQGAEFRRFCYIRGKVDYKDFRNRVTRWRPYVALESDRPRLTTAICSDVAIDANPSITERA